LCNRWPFEPEPRLQAECVQHGLRTLAFCKTRKLCELVTAYTRETLRDTAPHLTDTISVYRAGYSPQVRG
jgi:DEAD/DEAH box helicase domain-containing protein